MSTPSAPEPRVAGISVPDTRLAAEATELVRSITSDLIYHHSWRVYWFGSLLGRRRGLSHDPELLYIAAMFHAIGLNAQFRDSGRRFEVDGADEARHFLQTHRAPEDSIRRVWTAIALHTTSGIPEYMEPEIALLAAGFEYDVLGIGYHDIGDAERAAVTALHPRPAFKHEILQAIADGVASKPETTFGNIKADVLDRFVPGFRRGDFVETVEQSPWPH